MTRIVRILAAAAAFGLAGALIEAPAAEAWAQAGAKPARAKKAKAPPRRAVIRQPAPPAARPAPPPAPAYDPLAGGPAGGGGY